MNRAPDGGLFVPREIPVISKQKLEELSTKTFSECVAQILNLYYDMDLSGWDIDFCAGRHAVKFKDYGHRITLGESWHNPEWNYSHFVRCIADRLDANAVYGFWMETAIRIAVFTGMVFQIISQKRLQFNRCVDISIVSGDFSELLAAWYAREMGIPVGNIICSCNDNSAIWELFHSGQFHTDGVCLPTLTPEADVILPVGAEQLIYCCGGVPAAEEYCFAASRGSVFELKEDDFQRFSKGIYISVVSEKRMLDTILGFYRTNLYPLSPYTALAYTGALDYRVNTGGNNHCLVVSEKSPECDLSTVAKALQMSEAELMKQIKKM